LLVHSKWILSEWLQLPIFKISHVYTYTL
jgi:hypothetical protein